MTKAEISNRMYLIEAVVNLNLSLAASLSAAPADRFTTCKGVYYSLHNLCTLLPPPYSPGVAQYEIVPPPSNAEWESALAAVLDLLSGRTVPLNRSLITLGCDCLCRVFDACRKASRSTCASTGESKIQIKELDFNKTLFELTVIVEDTSQSTAGGRRAALVALGRLGNWAGGKSVISLSKTLCKVITGTDKDLSIAASEALLDLLEGMDETRPNIPTINIISKAAMKALTDRSAGPLLRRWGARLASAVVAFGGMSSVSSLLSICIRGMVDDEDATIRLAFATAVGNILASVVRHSSNNVPMGSEGHQQSDRVKTAKRGGDIHRKKLNVTQASEKWHPPLSESGYTVESACELLVEIFFRWSYPSTDRVGLAATAAAFISYFSDCRTQFLVTPSVQTVSELLLTILGLLDSDKLPSSATDASLVRTVVQWIFRDGFSAHAYESVQLILSREIINLLEQYNKSTGVDSGLGLGSKTLNDHQLQACLVELSHLATVLGQAAGSLKVSLVPCLLPFLCNTGYGIRFEAAVAVAALGKALAPLDVSILSWCLSYIHRIFSTLFKKSPTTTREDPFYKEVSTFENIFEDGVVGRMNGLLNDLQSSTGIKKSSMLCTMHGHGMAISMLLQVILERPSGAPSSLKEKVLELGESLVMTQFPEDENSALTSPNRNGRGPSSIGLICTCVRTGWTILASLFPHGGQDEGKYFTRLYPLWERSVSSAKEGYKGALALADTTQELIFLDASMRALLCFTRCCLGTVQSVPGALDQIIHLLDDTMDAVSGRLNRPGKPQGIVCRTVLKTTLMECFSWLPPGSFPSTCERLFSWGLDHVSVYNDNGIASSLLSIFLNSQDDVLNLPPTTSEMIALNSVPPTTEYERFNSSLGMHVLVHGVPIRYHERDILLCSGPMWPYIGGNYSSIGAGERESGFLPFDPTVYKHAPGYVANPRTPLHGTHWLRPATPVASINVRLIDAAVTIFGATFGYVDAVAQAKAIDHIVDMLPEAYQPSMNEPKKSELLGGFGALQVVFPSLLPEDEKKKKNKASRSALSVHNAVALLLSLLRSLPPCSDNKFHVELPWLSKCRDILVRLLSNPSPKVQRSAGEGIALLAEKMGDGFFIYLVQELLEILRFYRSHGKGKKSHPEHTTSHVIKSKLLYGGKSPTTTSSPSTVTDGMDSSSPAARAGVLFALSAIKRRMGRRVNIEWLWADVRSELAVGGDVPALTRVWGLHALAVIVQSSDDIINMGTSCQAPHQPESKLWLESVLELLEVHMLDCWPLEYESSLTAVLSELMSAVLQVAQGFQLSSKGGGGEPFIASSKSGKGVPTELSQTDGGSQLGLTISARLLALWCALSPNVTYRVNPRDHNITRRRGVLEDPRVEQVWLHFAELAVMLAPNEVSRSLVLPDIITATLCTICVCPVSWQAAGVISTASRLLRYLCCRLPGVTEAYKVELPLFHLFGKVVGGAVWEGTHIWRSLAFNRSVEAKCVGIRESATVIRDVLETIAEYDDARDRPLWWILLCRSVAMGAVISEEGNPDFQPPIDWVGACSVLKTKAETNVFVLKGPIGGVRWQIRHLAIVCCTKALRGIYLASGNITRSDGGGSTVDMGEQRTSTLLMDIKQARAEIDSTISTEKAILGLRLWSSDGSYISPRYTCLFLEDIVSAAVSAAMASTADSELVALQEGGVTLLTMVILIFGLVLDPDVSEPALVHVHGQLVRRRALFLVQSASQISSAARLALSSLTFPSLVRRGCTLATVLVGLGLIVDPLVLKRLVRQIIPQDLLKSSNGTTTTTTTALTAAHQQYRYPFTNVTSVIATEEWFHRLAMVAELVLLSRGVGTLDDQLTMAATTCLLQLKSLDLPDSVAYNLWRTLQLHICAIRPCWLACCVDAVRLNQGRGQWPSYSQPAKDIYPCYTYTFQMEMCHRSLDFLWPAMAAAFVMTSHVRADVCQFLIDATPSPLPFSMI